eukprot:5083801-Alexandrium_andersonii.AAC.1
MAAHSDYFYVSVRVARPDGARQSAPLCALGREARQSDLRVLLLHDACSMCVQRLTESPPAPACRATNCPASEIAP